MDKENLAINLQKCEKHDRMVRFHKTPQGTTPLITKTEAIMKLEHPKTLKQLRSFMGSIHHLIKFIPKLAELTEPQRPLLKKQDNKNKRLNWNEIHSQVFKNIKQKMKQIIESKHFDTTKETRSKCDASNKGLGPVLNINMTMYGTP